MSDDTVISDVIVATGAHGGHRSPNERADVMTGSRGAPLLQPPPPQRRSRTFNYLTSCFLQVQRDFLDGEVGVKWGDLLTHYQQVLDQEELPIYLGLWNGNETDRHATVRARLTQKEIKERQEACG